MGKKSTFIHSHNGKERLINHCCAFLFYMLFGKPIIMTKLSFLCVGENILLFFIMCLCNVFLKLKKYVCSVENTEFLQNVNCALI